LHGAGGVTAIVVQGVAVVAHLAGSNLPVPANFLFRALASGRTAPVFFYLADAVAAVAWQGVAIVAFLDAILVVDTVAASLGELGDASGGAGAVAFA
jgi:hypothetical protein